MEQCELVRITNIQEQQKRGSIFSAKGRTARNVSNGGTQRNATKYHHMPIFQHGSMTLKTPGLSQSKGITFSSQASDRGAIAITLDNTINSGAAGPTPGPRLETATSKSGAYRTIVSGSQHRRVQSSDYNTLQLSAAAHTRN